MNASLTRRDLLSGLAAAIATAGTAGFPSALYADAEVTLDQFIALSEWLTGTPNLDPNIAKILLGGFLTTGKGAALTRLFQRRDEHGEVANAVVAAWYSGLYDTGKGKALATFDQALLWNVLSFTKPFATCGGNTGYWANPPET